MWFAIALCAIIQTACGLNVVSDCGAKGDGKTDDTDSIQKCILQAFQVSTSSEISFPSGEDLKISAVGTPKAATSTAFYFGQGFVRSNFNTVLIFGDDSIGSGIRSLAVTDTCTFRDVQIWNIIGTGIEIGWGSEVRIMGGRVIGKGKRRDGSIGIHVTGNNGGVHVDSTDVIALGTGMMLDSSNGHGSNREIFITHATFDSDGRGISIGDNSYVSVAGIWAASSDIDQIWVAPGLDNPLLVITGGTIYNGGVYGGNDCSTECNGITVNSGSFILNAVEIRNNQGRAIWVPNSAVTQSTITSCHIFQNGVGWELDGNTFMIANNVCNKNAGKNIIVNENGSVITNNLNC